MLSMQFLHAGLPAYCETTAQPPSVPLEPLLDVVLLLLDPPEPDPDDDPPPSSLLVPPLSSPEVVPPLLLLLNPPLDPLLEHPVMLLAPTSPMTAAYAAILAAFDISTLQPGPEYVRSASRVPREIAWAQHGHNVGVEWSRTDRPRPRAHLIRTKDPDAEVSPLDCVSAVGSSCGAAPRWR
jgi:hypothetical protein